MFKYIFLVFVCLFSTLNTGEAVKCYHCYDYFNKTVSLGSITDDIDFNENYVRCDNNMNNWNSWDCPAKWPVCIIMSGKVGKHYEVVRSCGKKNFCSIYVPPSYVKLDSCRECNTTLCNDFPQFPDKPGPRFVFNININLNMKKNSLVEGGEIDD